MQDPIEIKEKQESFEAELGSEISSTISDDELVQIINSDLSSSKQNFDALLKIKQKNFNYFKGNHKSQEFQNDTPKPIVNRVFVSIETKTAIITAETPEPWVKVYPQTKAGRRLENKLTRKLNDLWEYDVNMQQLMERHLRNYYMGRVSFLKWGFDSDKRRPWTSVVDLESVRFDLSAREVGEFTFFAHYIRKPLTEVVRMFPEAKEELLKAVAKTEESANSRSMLTLVEYYTYFYENDKRNLMVVWKYDNVILGKEVNPNWNDRGKNHLDEPRIPFIPLNSISTGNSIVDDTSEIEQAIPLQDNINKRKAQYDRNAEMANGILVASESAMEETDFDEIGPDTRKVYLRGKNQNIANGFGVVTGRPFDQGLIIDMQDSKSEFDNIMGTHDTTRGESSRSETLGGQALRRDADMGRLDLTTRSYERSAEDWYNAMIQLMYVYDFKDLPILTEDKSLSPQDMFARLKGMIAIDERDDYITKKDLKDFSIKAIVKKGANIPMDPMSLRQDAMTLRQTQSIDTQSFVEMYNGRPPKDARTVAKRAFMEVNMPEKLYPELFDETGGIDPSQITHIEQILGATDDTERERVTRLIFDEVENLQMFTPEELQALALHIGTLQAYIHGAEIDENLPQYTELDDKQRSALLRHLTLETGILNMQLKNQPQPEESEEEPLDQELEEPEQTEEPTELPL